METEPYVISENSTFVTFEWNALDSEAAQLPYDGLLYAIRYETDPQKGQLDKFLLVFENRRITMEGINLEPLFKKLKERAIWIVREIPEPSDSDKQNGVVIRLHDSEAA